ncbi:MAG TPA: hypothetical protein PLR36_05005 [Ferruginibacter sp.]|nr:hypothetical protein [Chitinophagaceae bacterium]MBP7716926.1 hypothetical protein [Ferruginibacter sp.]HAZ93510.1 hypothetical protein [Chitinophagaceae bacterium]HPA23069.1 hypothetical protein [Ferruginibacter sp.]HRB55710.1 hypothetical protein [Ferruginibacter sp.]
MALSIIIISCQKEDFVNGSRHLPHENLTAKFFNHLHPLRQQVLRVYNELERQNNLTGFIEKFAKAEGMAA